MANNEYPLPPQIPPKPEEVSFVRWGRQINRAIDGLMHGRSNNVGEVTLSASTAASVVSDVRVNINSAIQFVPTTSNAALDASSAGGVWASTVANGSFTITHPNNANSDKTFKYVITG